MPRKKRTVIADKKSDDVEDDDFFCDDSSGRSSQEPPHRNAANARERARMRVLSKAFCRLKTTLPWVPADTKLSKLDTLRLATSYIAHLRALLREPKSAHTTPHPLSLAWPFAFQHGGSFSCSISQRWNVTSPSDRSGHFQRDQETNDYIQNEKDNNYEYSPHEKENGYEYAREKDSEYNHNYMEEYEERGYDTNCRNSMEYCSYGGGGGSYKDNYCDMRNSYSNENLANNCN